MESRHYLLPVTISAAQADAFYREGTQAGAVWSVKDAGGFPSPHGTDGARAMPFWSKRSRAEKVVSSVVAYAGFDVVPISLRDFRDR